MRAFYLALLFCPIFSFCQGIDGLIDPVSQSSLHIITRRGIHVLKTGTGFVIEVKGRLYLITNNHVASEEYAQNEHLRDYKTLIPKDSIADNFIVYCYSNTFGKFPTSPIRIRKKSGEFQGIKFYENDKDTASILDVVAFSIMPSELKGIYQPIRQSEPTQSLLLYPGMDLFVVGFPSDSSFASPLPIWKRGTIASEPNLLNVGSSQFIIDATTRGGMSGSPVFFRGTSAMDTAGRFMLIQSSNGVPTILVGIYSAQWPHFELGLVTRLEKIYRKLSDMNP